MSYRELFEIQSELCKAMGHPLRMEIMDLLRNGPMTVNEIAAAIGQNQSTVSRNLATLRNAGLVIVQREGTNILNRVANPKLLEVCDLMREVLIEQIDERSRLIQPGVE